MFNNPFKHKLTSQEQQFVDIVQSLLSHPKTVLKMTPLSDKYFIINEQKHYHILLKELGIQVTNTKFSIAKRIHPQVYNKIINIIHEYIERDRQIDEDRIFNSEVKMLDSVLKNLE